MTPKLGPSAKMRQKDTIVSAFSTYSPRSLGPTNLSSKFYADRRTDKRTGHRIIT